MVLLKIVRPVKPLPSSLGKTTTPANEFWLIIPDNTRSGPIGDIFKIIYDCLEQKAKAVDCLVALGTHRPLSEEQICTRLCMTADERGSKYASVKFFQPRMGKKRRLSLP